MLVCQYLRLNADLAYSDPLKKGKEGEQTFLSLAGSLKMVILEFGLHTLSLVAFAIILHRDAHRILHWKQS